MQFWCCTLCYVLLIGFVPVEAVRRNFFFYGRMCICPKERDWGRQARSQSGIQGAVRTQSHKIEATLSGWI